MALMQGSGPFGREPGGVFNFSVDAPAHQLYLESSPRRIRVVVGGEVIADSSQAMLLHETGLMPVYYLPWSDVRQELLTPTDLSTHCPFKGDASYWSITAGDQVRENAIWRYLEPIDGAPPLADLAAFQWDAVDAWFEEAEQLVGHPRDPYHRVDVVPSDRHVVVSVDGTVIASSDRPTMVFETGMPPRTYLPEEDVIADVLEPSATQTTCAYKGTTSRYHSIRVGDRFIEDAIWVYDDPKPEAVGLAGLLAFFDDKVDIEVAWERFGAP